MAAPRSKPNVSERHYQQLFAALADPVFVLDTTDTDRVRVVDANAASEELFGIPAAQCIDRAITDLLPTPTASRFAIECERCNRTKLPVDFLIELAGPNGVAFDIKLNVLPHGNDETGLIAAVARTANLQSGVDAALHSDQFRVIAEYAADFISRSDSKGRVMYQNPAVERLLGVKPQQAIGRNVSEWEKEFPQGKLYRMCIENVAATGRPQTNELYFINPSTGETVHHHISYAPEYGANGEVVSVIAIGRDITQLKNVETQLREHELQFRTMAENLPDLVMRCDLDGRVLYISPRITAITGVEASAYAGMHIRKVDLSRHAPGRNGQAAALLAAFDAVIRSGSPEVVELSTVDLNGAAHCFEFRLAPERNAHGDMTSVLLLGRDISKEKAAQAELKALNATLEQRVAIRTLELERANRDLRSFASTASHDLRAPLRTIGGYIDLIATDEGERLSTQGRYMLERIASATTKLNNLIDAILAYSHAGQCPLSGKLVAVDAVAREAAEELIVQPSKVHIEITNLPAAQADSTMLRQIFQNLIGNAIKFSARVPEPRITVDWFDRDGEIVYFVRDNGSGFDMQHADRLFSMFYRLHREDEFPGSGIGLAIVKRLVERHGGQLWADSQPQHGATFYFTLSPKLPRTQATASSGSNYVSG